MHGTKEQPRISTSLPPLSSIEKERGNPSFWPSFTTAKMTPHYRLVQVKRRTKFPGQSPHRFFESDRENLHTSYMSPFSVFCCCFAWFFFGYDYLGNLDLLRANIFGEITFKINPEVIPRDGHIEHVQNFRVYLLKNSVDFRTFVRKTCKFCVVALIT